MNVEPEENVESEGNVEFQEELEVVHYTDILQSLQELTENYNPNQKNIEQIKQELLVIFEPQDQDNGDSLAKVKAFYKIISDNDFEKFKEIKKDTRIQGKRFAAGIVIIAATVLTGILPGLIIMGLVALFTKKHVGHLFEAEKIGEALANTMKQTLIKTKIEGIRFFSSKDENNFFDDNDLNDNKNFWKDN